MHRLITAFVAASLLACVSAYAQDDEAETIVVTATKREIPISQVGSTVSVLMDEDLDVLGVSYVEEALRTLPGLSVTQNGGPGGFTSVRIRGEESYRTLVLIDGIRVDDPAGTQIATNFANLLTDNVARIEVVRGPQSLLYGADAIGGIVQILTPRPGDGLNLAGELSGGAYGTAAASGLLLYGTETAGLALSASVRTTEGFSAKVGDPELEDPDGQSVYNLHGVVTFEPSDSLSFEGVARYIDAEVEFDGASAFPPFSPADPNRELLSEEIAGRAAMTWRILEGRVSTELAYAASASDRDDLSNGTPFIFGSAFDGERQNASVLSTISVTDRHTFLIGVDHEDVSATTDTIDEEMTASGAYAEWQGELARNLFLTGGVRYDDSDEFGSHWSGRGTAALIGSPTTGETTRFHASYGTGFRAPSPFEQATNRAALLPRLVEETSQGWDVGVSQTFFAKSMRLELTWFDQVIEDEIRFDNQLFTGYFQADGEASSRGLEVSLDVARDVALGALTQLELQSAYTYTDSEVNSPDAEDGLPRIRRPRHMSASTLLFRFGEASDVAFTVRTAAKAEDGFSSFRVPLDSYAALDISAQLRMGENAELFARGVNVFNEQYEEVDDYATSDAAVFIGLRLRR